MHLRSHIMITHVEIILFSKSFVQKLPLAKPEVFIFNFFNRLFLWCKETHIARLGNIFGFIFPKFSLIFRKKHQNTVFSDRWRIPLFLPALNSDSSQKLCECKVFWNSLVSYKNINSTTKWNLVETFFFLHVVHLECM